MFSFVGHGLAAVTIYIYVALHSSRLADIDHNPDIKLSESYPSYSRLRQAGWIAWLIAIAWAPDLDHWISWLNQAAHGRKRMQSWMWTLTVGLAIATALSFMPWASQLSR